MTSDAAGGLPGAVDELTALSAPRSAPHSPDGRYWWDGTAWRAVLPAAPAAAPAVSASSPVAGHQVWPSAPLQWPSPAVAAPAGPRSPGARTIVAVCAVALIALAGGGAALGVHSHNAAVAAASSSSSSSSASSASSVSSVSSVSSASSASSASSRSSESSAASSSSLSSALAASSSAAAASSASAVAAANAVTPDSAVAPDKGSVVYTDDFHDAASGWLTGGSHGTYVTGGYQFGATGQSVFYSPAPYYNPVPQLAMSVTATTDGAVGGFGVACADVTTTGGGVSYEFFALGDGYWLIARRDHVNQRLPVELASGRATATPGKAPVTVEGVCASLAGGNNVRLMLFINGHKSADISDHPAAVPSDGWIGFMTTAAPISIVASSYLERNLDS
jgi:hypothetical protein